MNPISIFPPPTRALSRHNTRSAGNPSSASANALSRSQTHSVSGTHSSSTAAQDSQDPNSSVSSTNTANHGRNRSFGSAVGSASTIWTPFTSTNSNNKDHNHEASSGPNSASSHSHSHHPVAALTAATPATAPNPPAPSSQTSSPTSNNNNNSSNTPRKLIKKRNNNSNASPASTAPAGASSSPMPDTHLRTHPHQTSSHPTSPSFGPVSHPHISSKRKPTPDIPARLPQTLFFDRLRLSEVTAAYRLEVQGYPEEDAAPLEKLRYRQAAAPHLFLGAFLPGSSNLKSGKGDGGASGGNSKDSGSASGTAGANHGGAGGSSGSGSSEPPRTLVGFITGTAALALTLRSMSTHSNSKDARLVCIHSVVVAPEYQHKGLALRMLREYIGRLMRNELGPHDARIAALAEAKAAAAAAATAQGSSEEQAVVASTKAPVAFADDDLIGDEDDEAEVENERSGDRQRRKRGYQALALLAHQEIVPLYLKAGFRVQGLSHVNYGSGDWYEMRREIVPKNFLSKHESSDEAGDDDDDDDEDGGEKLAATKPSSGWLEPRRSPVPASRSASQGSHDSTTPKGELLSPSDAHSKDDSLKVVGTDNGGNSSDEGARGGISSSPPGLILPPTFSTSALLAALTSSSSQRNKIDNDKLQSPAGPASTAGANALGSSPAGSGIISPPQAPRNPGIPFSTVLGQALAGKTASEDPRSTLEARLVNRDEDTNIADLYCPREQCDCILLRADLGVWKARELGPLCAPALQSTSEVLPPNTPAPPLNGVTPPPPRPSEDQHASPLLFAANQRAGAPHQQQQQQVAAASSAKVSMQGATSLRDFWSVPSPFVFDNISFSKDVQWPPAKPPKPARKGSALVDPVPARGRSNSGSVLSSPPGLTTTGTATPPALSAAGEVEKRSKLSSSSNTSLSTPSSPRVKEGSSLSPRERSQSGSALNMLGGPMKSPLSAGSDATARTPGEELQRALFGQGVEANMTGALKYPSSGPSEVLGTNGGASASTPLLIPPKDRGSGSKMGLKVTIGKRKTSLAVPTLSTVASQAGEGAPSSAPGGPSGSTFLSPGGNTPQVTSPSAGGHHGWASTAASAGKKGLAAALGRGKNKDKDKERDGDASAAASPAIGSSSAFGGAAESSTALVGSANPAPGHAGGGSTPVKPIRKASGYGIDPHAYPFNTSSAFSSGSWHIPGGASPSAAAASEPESPTLPSLTIKYLLCPECDCGPLGYVVISDEMKSGGLARSVAASQGGRDEGGKQEGAGEDPKRKMEYLLAADRVRYRFKAN